MTQRRLTHSKPNSIWLFDYLSLEAMDDCPELPIFLSERDVQIILQATKDIERFQSRVWAENTGNVYLTVDDTQFETFQGWVSDMFNNIGGYQLCNEYMQRIAEALEGMVGMSNCCGGIEGVTGGSSGSGMEPTAPSTTDSGEEARTGSPPAGYTSWEEFDQKQCDWVNKILDDIVTDIATMGSIQITTSIGVGLAAILVPLLITPVGWVVLLEIAVLMIAAAATAGFYGFLSTHMETYRSDYKCALLNGTDVVSSIANFGNAVDENIAADSNFNSLTGYWASGILKPLASTDSVNRLYDSQAFSPTTGDCSECSTALIFPSLYGTCTPELVAGSNAGPSATYRSCVTSAFGSDRALMTIATTEAGLERQFSNWNLVEGPDSSWVFAYVDENGDVQSVNCDDLSEVPDPLLAESWQIVRGNPSDTDNFDLQFDVEAV